MLLIRVLRRASRVARFNGLSVRPRWGGLAGRVTVLLYHRVCEHGEAPYLEKGGVPVIPPAVLLRHLNELKQVGAVFLTLRDLADGRFPGPTQPGIVVTFDDGFRDNFRVAAPLLSSLGIRATFLVASDVVEAVEPLWEHRLYWLAGQAQARIRLIAEAEARLGQQVADGQLLWALRSLATPSVCGEVLDLVSRQTGPFPQDDVEALYPRWEELRSAVALGHEIGSHGASHRMRHLLSAENFRHELERSKSRLEEGCQREVTSFSYPFNGYLFGDEALCREAGFTVIATVDPGRVSRGSDLSAVPRTTLHSLHENGAAFRQALLEEAT